MGTVTLPVEVPPLADITPEATTAIKRSNISKTPIPATILKKIVL